MVMNTAEAIVPITTKSETTQCEYLPLKEFQ